MLANLHFSGCEIKIENILRFVTVMFFSEFVNFPGFNGLLAQTESEFNRSSILIDCITFKYPDLVNFTVHYHYAHSSTPIASNLDDKYFWFQQTLKVWQKNINAVISLNIKDNVS